MTLISIVGDFHSSTLPIFYHFKDEIKTHIILYDDFKRDVMQAQKIINGTKSFIAQNNLPIKSYAIQINEDSYESIKKAIEIFKDLEPNLDNIYINATDGLSTVALYLSQQLINSGVKFIGYDKFDNTYNLFSSELNTTKNSVKSMKILEHFRLKDISIISIQDKNLADELEDDLNILFTKFYGNKRDYSNYSSNPHSHIENTAVGFLYELYIYNLLKYLNHDDIQIGVKLNDVYDENTSVENEFDILIMKNNHLHMIECKFQTSIKKVELIYKADSIKQTLDDESKIMILSNEGIYFTQERSKHLGIYKRSNAKKIYLRGSPLDDLDRFIKEIDDIFNLQTKDIDTIIKEKVKIEKNEHKGIEQELKDYLYFTFMLDIDYFDSKEVLRLLNYKIIYARNDRVYRSMNNAGIKQLIRHINTMLNSKRAMSIEFIYNYYESVLKK
jgi:hypothetical protein